MSRSATSADRMEAAENLKRCVQLRKLGKTQREIAAMTGISATTVNRYLKKALAEYRSDIQAEVEDWRAWENARIDSLLGAIWPSAMQGNLGAVDRFIRLAERRAKLLGLDMPTKIAPTNADGTQEFRGLRDLLDAYEHLDDDDSGDGKTTH